MSKIKCPLMGISCFYQSVANLCLKQEDMVIIKYNPQTEKTFCNCFKPLDFEEFNEIPQHEIAKRPEPFEIIQVKRP